MSISAGGQPLQPSIGVDKCQVARLLREGFAALSQLANHYVGAISRGRHSTRPIWRPGLRLCGLSACPTVQELDERLKRLERRVAEITKTVTESNSKLASSDVQRRARKLVEPSPRLQVANS